MIIASNQDHLWDIAAIDFFIVPTATFRILYVFLVLRHDRRRILHVNVTAHPTSSWTAQQMIEALPFDTSPVSLQYAITPFGETALGFLDELRKWSEAHCRLR